MATTKKTSASKTSTSKTSKGKTMAETKAPVAPPEAGSTKPGTKDEKAKKTKVEKVMYPGLQNAEGDDVKLDAWPDDFDSKKHKPLKKTNFNDETILLEQKAIAFEKKAAEIREEIQAIKTTGSPSVRKKQRQADNVLKRLGALLSDLQGSGAEISDSELLAKLKQHQEEEASAE